MKRSSWFMVLWCVGAFLIPCAIVGASLFLLHLYPFGDTTLSVWDLQVTYTYFYEWFNNLLQGEGNIFYSFTKSLGGNMYAGFANLCASPLMLLMPLFERGTMLDFVTVMITLKFGFAGFAAFFYLDKRFSLPRVFSLALSICYAMMLFMTTQTPNPMWLDVVVILPFVMYGTYLLIHEGKIAVFFVSVLLSILINWYNGYMVCLFVLFFYLFESYLAAPKASRVRCKILVRPGRFLIVLTLAVAASAILLLPTAVGLLAGKGAAPGGLFTFEFRYYFPEMIRSLFLGVYEKEMLPQLYCGMFTLLCVVWFFLNAKIGKREKIATGVFIGFMLVSTWFAPLDRIWLGFRDGNSFYCRFAFLVSSLFVFTAARNLQTLSKDNCRSLVVSGGIIGVISVLVFCSGHYPRLRFFVLTIFLLVAFVACLIFWSRSTSVVSRRIISVLLVCLVGGEALVSCHDAFRYRTLPGVDYYVTGYDRYDSYYREGADQLNELDAVDNVEPNDYRLGKTYSFMSPYRPITSNEGMVLGYSQIAQYDSAYDDRVQNFVSALGYSPNISCVTVYNDPVLLSDALLGIRYVSAQEKPAGFIDVGTQVAQEGNRFYENPYALPLGYGVSRDVLTDVEVTKNPFTYQNAIISALVGHTVECYKAIPSSLAEKADGEVQWTLDAPAGEIAYGYIEGPDLNPVDLYLDDRRYGLYLDVWSHGIFPLSFTEGEEVKGVSLRQTIKPDGVKGPNVPRAEDLNFYAYSVDQDVLAEAMTALSKHPFDVEVLKDGYVRGTYSSDGNGVLFTTIPYDEGWSVTINGEKAKPLEAQKTFMAFDVSEGENVIEMTYISPGFIPGLLVSVFAIVGFVLYAWYIHRWDSKTQCKKRAIGASTYKKGKRS